MKSRLIVPTLMTLGNAVCGLASIAYASRIGKADSSAELDLLFMYLSGWLIVAAMLFDTLDGFFARLFKAAGRFGAELDSLCDAISFGAAPAFLLLQLGPGRDAVLAHQVLATVASLYMMCAVLRLARFNVEAIDGASSGKRFRGLPSPAAAGCIASLAILRGGLTKQFPAFDVQGVHLAIEVAATAVALGAALLMVSAASYPHLTKQMIRGKRGAPWLLVGVAVVLAAALRDASLVVLFWGYAAGGLVPKRASVREREESRLPAPPSP